jgi:hypothetical protein
LRVNEIMGTMAINCGIGCRDERDGTRIHCFFNKNLILEATI